MPTSRDKKEKGGSPKKDQDTRNLRSIKVKHHHHHQEQADSLSSLFTPVKSRPNAVAVTKKLLSVRENIIIKVHYGIAVTQRIARKRKYCYSNKTE